MGRDDKFLLEEYRGLIAIDQEARLDNLLIAVSPKKGVRLQRLRVPPAALGKSLRKADFRNQFGAHVIAVKLGDGGLQIPPGLERPLSEHDQLLALMDSGTEDRTANPADRGNGRSIFG